MKVALIGSGMLPIPPPGWGAVERAIYGLSEGLKNLGVEVEIINKVRGSHSFDEYPFALGLPFTLKKGNWDIIHASTPVVANVLAAVSRHYVYTSHSRHWFGTASPTERWGLFLETRACSIAQKVIALTPDVAGRISDHLPSRSQSNLRVIPNGIDTKVFKPNWDARTGKEVLGVGAVHRRKRWHLAAKAMSSIKGAHLTIVGPIQDREYADSLVSLATPGKLYLAGELSEDELAKRYAQSDVFIHPSGSELMSIAVMEAMSSGLPVVGTSILASQVEDGKTGWLTEEAKDETEILGGFENRLGSLLTVEDLRKRFGLAAREQAQELWDWSVVAKRVYSLYQEILMDREETRLLR
jgi:glycosyltransferase involved in cell wall biosynthesis